jgi:SAM-dependent methyltransferase
MPHTLEASNDPYAALREAARVLVPEGRLVISGLNPGSPLGAAPGGAQCGLFAGPEPGVGYWRLRDWL